MFSMKSTWKEIKTTKPVDTALGDLFPTCWSILLQGHEEETMEQIHDRVHMEWGEAFWSQPLVNCANMLMETAEKQKFLFVPLWHTQKEGWIPKEDQNDEEGVWLFTGNPDVDQQAFMHFDDCASVPPYPSAAVCKERRQEKKRPAVIFCPGGGYEMLSYYSEGVQLAQRMERDGGYKAFILSYRIQPNTYPQCQMDLALAIMHVRAHARQYGIDENRILVVGASAGGHLCASTAMLHEELKTEIFCVHPELEKLYGRISARPDGVGLLYPVISFTSEYHEGSCRYNTGGKSDLQKKLSVELHDLTGYPPTYAYANLDDGCVPASNTTRLDAARTKAGVKHLCETFPTGDHGIGLGYATSAKAWSEHMLRFFNETL